MEATKELIEYEDFVQDLEGLDEIAALLGYGEDLPLRDDWSVSFAKSTYAGLPCRIFGHTECDFIFLRDKDADDASSGVRPRHDAAGMAAAHRIRQRWRRSPLID